MPDLTTKLGLKKPLGNETVSRLAYNENLDLIDAQTQKEIIKSYTAPVNPVNDDLWIDTSINPNKLKRYNTVTSLWEDISYEHPATHPPSIIAQDTNNRFVTDTEKATWNGKQDYLSGDVASHYHSTDRSWANITGKPSTFTPSAHKSSHSSGGSDVIAPSDIGAVSVVDNNKFLSDYEYQNPTIVGTQIRIQKQSNTNILKFKLASDITGGSISISLDGGATSKPLNNVDGVTLVELKKGFVEVIADANFFILRPRESFLSTIKNKQTGAYLFVNTQTVIDIPISAVDLTIAVPRISHGAYWGTAARDLFIAELTSPTNLRLTRASDLGNGGYIYWEVIEFNNVKSLQYGTLTKDTTTNVSVTVTAVDINKSMVFNSMYNSSTTGYGTDYLIGVGLTSSTNLQFSGHVACINKWFILEFN